MSRVIVVDDTSPLISYDGLWTDGGNYFTPGAPPYETLQALIGSGSFTFSFTGSTVAMVGAFQTAGTAIPTWTCLLNGNTIISTPGPFIFDLGAVNTTVLCQSQNIVTEPSNLTVVVSGTAETPFLFSHIEYTPVASTILDNATVAIFPIDTVIQYDSGWNKSDPNDYQAETSTQGATMIFDFVGVQVAWITSPGNSFNPGAHPGTVNSSASYSVDNGNQIPFLVPVLDASNTPYISFQTPILSPGPHSLVVEYGSGVQVQSGSAPLILDYLLIQNLTIPPSTTPGVPNLSSTSGFAIPSSTPGVIIPSSTPGVVNLPGLSKGTIAGVVIGCAIGLALIIFILIWIIRRRFVRVESSEETEPLPRMASLDGLAQPGQNQPGRG